MNINDYPDELRVEEQAVLDRLIARMNRVLDNLDDRMKDYVNEANDADISINPDLYLAKVLAQQGLKDTTENRKKILQARDELYNTRLLLHYEEDDDEGVEEIKVGLHTCMDGADQFVTSWTIPLCRHFIMDNGPDVYDSVVKLKHGREQHTKYRMLVKNQVTLRFTHVKKALNLFPGVFDDRTLEMIKGTDFLSDDYLNELISHFNPDDFDPDAAAQIIADEFLQELLERRSTPEFKNIVFSIQKKQGEIIQSPLNNNLIVQGCAGSGKSMIMLHRLPIILYDNPNSLSRTNLYIITPSQMYIQLAESMRYQLEISDINMGTIEQYYDYCIGKYPGHKEREYGKINYGSKISLDKERYIYSRQCVEDIVNYYEAVDMEDVSLDKAYSLFSIKDSNIRSKETHLQRISDRILKLQKVINSNSEVVLKYFKGIRAFLDSLNALSVTLKHRKNVVIREITKQITKNEEKIVKAERQIEQLNDEDNVVAIENRKNAIIVAKNKIDELREEIIKVDRDEEHFDSLKDINEKIEEVLAPFIGLKSEFIQNKIEDVYKVINRTGQLIGGFYMLSWEMSKIDDKYAEYIGPLGVEIEKVRKNVNALQNITEKYLDFEYYNKILKEHEKLDDFNTNAIRKAYELIMHNIGIESSENGKIRAIKCSPYIYLQAIFCYQGVPSYKESLLAIDEVQGIAPEEIRLLKNINGNNVVLNMFGDVNQHIEGTKGIDSWDEYNDIVDYEFYEMLENYRNASQITEHCNRVFDMNMIPINTPGKGVHELITYDEFHAEMITQLMDTQRAGLAAILVSNDAEARSLLNKFSAYDQKFHDMTDEDFSIHRTRWNIINIDDAKGLEFSSVIVLSGRMSRNERYIAFTRALDDLYIYDGILDIAGFEKKSRKKKEDNNDESTGEQTLDITDVVTETGDSEVNQPKHKNVKVDKKFSDSEVRRFFENSGVKVVDNRDRGGRLWIVGEREAIRSVVNEAISTFGISGKYTSSKEIDNKSGWCTKTDK